MSSRHNIRSRYIDLNLAISAGLVNSMSLEWDIRDVCTRLHAVISGSRSSQYEDSNMIQFDSTWEATNYQVNDSDSGSQIILDAIPQGLVIDDSVGSAYASIDNLAFDLGLNLTNPKSIQVLKPNFAPPIALSSPLMVINRLKYQLLQDGFESNGAPVIFADGYPTWIDGQTKGILMSFYLNTGATRASTITRTAADYQNNAYYNEDKFLLSQLTQPPRRWSYKDYYHYLFREMIVIKTGFHKDWILGCGANISSWHSEGVWAIARIVWSPLAGQNIDSYEYTLVRVD